MVYCYGPGKERERETEENGETDVIYINIIKSVSNTSSPKRDK